MLMVLALGSGLRLYGLEIQSLWNDELESWRQSNFSTLPEVVRLGVEPDTHPPAFQIVLFFVERHLGDREAFLRLPSALAGILTIAAVFWVGRRTYGDAEGLIAALLMATLWAPIYYSQEARNYALAMLFVLLASAFWLDIIRSLNQRLPIQKPIAFGFILCALASAYTHYFGLLVVGLQAMSMVVLSLMNGHQRRTVGVSIAAIALGYVPWIPAMLGQFTHTDRISWIPAPKITAFPAFISFAFNQSKPLALVVLLLYVLLFYRLVVAFSRDRTARLGSLLASPDFLLAYWLVLPLTLTYIVSALWTPILTQRNLLVSLPPAYLLLARAITVHPFRRPLQEGLALGLVGVALYRLIFVMGYYTYPYKEQYREAVQFVLDHSPRYPDSTIIGYSRFADYFDYYFARLGSPRRLDLVAGENGDQDRVQSFVSSRSPDNIWFIAAHRIADQEFVAFMEHEYTLVLDRSFLGARVWLYGNGDLGSVASPTTP